MKDKLYRSRIKRVLGGVAGGLSEYLNLDPILVRIILIIIALLNGLGIILYIVLWIIIPEEPFEHAFNMGPSSEPQNSDSAGSQPESSSKETEPKKNINFEDLERKFGKPKNDGGRIFAGIILIAAGLFFLVDNIFPHLYFEDYLPVALIAIGIVLVWHSIKKNRDI